MDNEVQKKLWNMKDDILVSMFKIVNCQHNYDNTTFN